MSRDRAIVLSVGSFVLFGAFILALFAIYKDARTDRD
jgi:hypothetical protein